MRWYGVLVVCVLLIGCGGVEDTKDGLGATTPDPKENIPSPYGDYLDRSQTLFDVWDGVAINEPINIPTKGSASYAGIARLSVEVSGGELALAGALVLEVDFKHNAITGNISSILNSFEQNYSGELLVTDGIIDRAADISVENTFQASINGVLTSPNETLQVNAIMAGDFHGNTEGAMMGAIAGTAISEIGTGYVFGDFVVQK